MIGHKLRRAWKRLVASAGPNSYAAVVQRYDAMTPTEALVAAWTVEGPAPDYHRACKAEVRRSMPLVARAIERIVDEMNTRP